MNRSILPHLPCFAAVAQQGSFSRAAVGLALTQAAVSYQIRQLEDKLGFALFIRSQGSRIVLTERGQLLLDEYRLLEKNLSQLLDHLQPRGSRQLVRITAPVDVGSLLLTPAIPPLQAQGLHIELHLADETIALAESLFDLAIRSDQRERGLAHEPLFESANVLVAGNAYLSHQGQPRRVADLASHHLLVRSRDDSRSWTELLAGAGLSMGDCAQQVLGNSFALLEGARCGLGIALLPEYLVTTALARGELAEVRLGDARVPATPFFLAYYPSALCRQWARQLRRVLVTQASPHHT